MKETNILIIIFLAVLATQCLDNGLAKTPNRGFSTYSRGCDVDQLYVKNQADQLISSGLSLKGYNYIIIDDCWQIQRNSTTGKLIEDPNKFPSGLNSLINYIHNKGLLFGLSTDIGLKTRSGKPGSMNYEKIDANTFATWGIDLIKIDNSQGILGARQRFTLLSQFVVNSGRKIFISINNEGKDGVQIWGGSIANTWRTSSQIKGSWESLTHCLDLQNGHQVYAKEGAWNDPGNLRAELPLNQFTAQFLLWVGLKAPLLIDIALNTVQTGKLEILKNQQLIAIHQDDLKKQMKLIRKQQFQKGTQQVWGGILSGKRFLLIFLNQKSEAGSMSISLTKQVGLSSFESYWIRDPKNKMTIGSSSNDIFKVNSIAGHSAEARILNF